MKLMDNETVAMGKLVEALKDLDKDTALRALRWACERFGMHHVTTPAIGMARTEPHDQRSNEFPDLPSLYTAAGAATQGEKAMVVAYWLQVLGGQEDWDSQSVNNELKNLGDGLKNVTDALNSVMRQSPRLVIQTRKSGTTKQARKRYKLTVEGVKRVRAMLAQNKDTLR